MDPQDTIDLSREAITMIAIIGGPILAAGLVIGLIVGIFQAMTQIQDQTVSAVPKILGMLAVTMLVLPWLSERMVDYTRQTLQTPMVGGITAPVNTSTLSPFQSRSQVQSPSPPPFHLASAATRLDLHYPRHANRSGARVAGKAVPLVAPPLKPAALPIYPTTMPTLSPGPSSMPVHRNFGSPAEGKSSMPRLRGGRLNAPSNNGRNLEG